MSEADQAEGGIVIKDKRFDFETCGEINLFNKSVRLLSLSLHDVGNLHDVQCIPRLPSASSPPAADMQLTPHAATADRRRHCAAVRQPGAVQAPEGDRLGKQGARACVRGPQGCSPQPGWRGGGGGSGAAVEGVTCGCGRDSGGRACNGVWCRRSTS
jgi:hypothetical protein